MGAGSIRLCELRGGNLEYEGNEKPWEVSDKRLTSSDFQKDSAHD